MKTLFLTGVILLASISNSCAQGFERVEVVQVDSASAIDLYHKAERWFVDAFNDANEVIQLRDSTARTIVGKANTTVRYQYGKMASTANYLPYSFALEFQAKEGRYRVRIYQVLLQGQTLRDEQCCWGKCDGGGDIFRQSMYAMCDRAREKQDELLQSLKTALSVQKASDW